MRSTSLTMFIFAVFFASLSGGRSTDASQADAMSRRLARRCATIWIEHRRCPTAFNELGLPMIMLETVQKNWRFACEGPEICIAFDIGKDTDSTADDTVSINVGGDARWNALGEKADHERLNLTDE